MLFNVAFFLFFMIYLYSKIGDLMIYIISSIFFILFICGAFVFFKVNKLKDIEKSLEIVSSNIEEFLERKLGIITKLLDDIDDDKIKKEFSYSDDFTLLEKEDSLFNISWNIIKYIKDNDLKDMKKDAHELNVLEENLDGLKDFYNANVLNYNEIYLKPSFNRVFKLFNFGDYKSFKIRKLELCI